MGIGLNSVHLLARPLRALGNLSQKTILTLGVQDCYFTYEQVLRFVRRHDIPHAPVSADEIALTTGFRWVPPHDRGAYRKFIHQRTLFRLLGFDPKNIFSMDSSGFEGADILHDLNLPVEGALFAKFDLIYDGGTMEHVFSVKDVLFNMSRMCKIGGLVVNFSPVDCINHGFINLNAELFHDFFSLNGYEQIELKYIAIPSHPRLAEQHYMEYSPKIFRSLQPYYNTGVYSVFRKVKGVPLQVPNQGIYDNLWQSDLGLVNEPSNGLQGLAFRAIRANLRYWVDRYFLLSVLVRGYRMIAKGKRVSL